ncbi:MAG: translation elongation factor Ts [Thermoflexales bacterium]|nr:translation elongation factor Ts [Thermoflexales bacterium]
MEISTALIKQLRELSGAGVLDCRKTLEQTGGDLDKAAAILREKGLSKAAKKAERAALEGRVELYAHPGDRVGVMLELNCETDFVAKNEAFKSLAHELALHIAFASPSYLQVQDIPADVIEAQKARFQADARASGKPEAVLDKIVQGKLEKFYDEVCLLRQAFVKDDKVKVGDLITSLIVKTGENIVVRRFARYELGQDV